MSKRQQEQKRGLPLNKKGTNRNEEDKNVGNSCQGQKRSSSCCQRNFDKRNHRYEHGGYKPEPTQLRKADGKEEIRDVQGVPQLKHTPNTIRHNKRVRLHIEAYIQITVQREPLEGEVRQNTQNETLESWFKITVPDGMYYDKIWLMNSIGSHCSVPFTPVDFHYTNNEARFFVQGASAASALRRVSYKICDKKNQKIPIFVSTSVVPYSVKNKLKPREMEQLKLTISRRYNVSKKALHLYNLRYDPDFQALNIDIILNRRSCMAAILQIIKNNYPELLSLNLCDNRLYQLNGLSDLVQMAPTVKILNLSRNQLNSVCELDKMKGLKLVGLWLKGNPLCSTFPDQSTYISAIRNCFPQLLWLDGQVLPPPIVIDIDRRYLIKPCKESYKISDALKSLVIQFLRRYYLIYDYGDRRYLLRAYHDEACFSLTIPFNPLDPASSSLFEYFKDNRNMKSLRDPFLRVQLLKYTKRDIVCSLCVLPKTRHDLSSFVVEFWFQTENMVVFSVSGVFKEVEGRSQGSVRAFSRTFIAVPASNSGIFITNDELFVRDTIPKKTQSTFAIPVPTPIYSSLLSLSQEQKHMMLAFSIQFGVKLLWSQKCLQYNQWNYMRAGQVFIILKNNGLIPAEAFKQIP